MIISAVSEARAEYRVESPRSSFSAARATFRLRRRATMAASLAAVNHVCSDLIFAHLSRTMWRRRRDVTAFSYLPGTQKCGAHAVISFQPLTPPPPVKPGLSLCIYGRGAELSINSLIVW